MNHSYDTIIVGSGAGGCAAAYRLVHAGQRVLLIEKGEPLPLDGSTLDLDKVIRQGAFKNKEPWLDKDDRCLVPEEYFNLGGKTKWYGAALLRYGAHEFEAEPDFQCLPWPIAYRDLAPFYDEAETLLGVRRFEIEPDLRAIVDRLQRRRSGWQIEPLPLGLAPDILDYPAEAKHFDGFASVKGLKADAQHALLDHLGGRENLTIMTGQPVAALQGDYQAPHRLIGVVLPDGHRYSARTVLLAAGAMHSSRLLQRYMESSGLAKRLASYRSVGRYFKRHLLTALLALSPGNKTDLVRKTALFLNDEFPHSSIQPLGFDGELIATLMPGFVPHAVANAFGQRAYGFFLQTEDGSHEANRVIAEANGNGNGNGGHGAKSFPRLDYDPRRLRPGVTEHRRLVRAFRRALLAAGYVSFVKPIPLEGTAHACGTLAAGKDPGTSVVDAYGKVHGMDNLYVVDGSVLPRSSRVNPSLTIYAWALRVAKYLANQGQSHANDIARTDTVRA
jgi:choline dehydrogenase-like flavoprotein